MHHHVLSPAQKPQICHGHTCLPGGASRAMHPPSMHLNCIGPQHASSPTSVVSRRLALTSLTATSLLLGPASQSGAVTTSSPTILQQPPSTSTKLGFENRVEEFTLPNGLHFIVLPRSTAPVVSAHVYADVGAYCEEDGKTGLAHLLEHMAFKGTRKVGTKDWQQEAPLLDAMDEVFYQLKDLKQRGLGASAQAQQAADKLKQLQAQADELVVPGYGALLSRAGAVGLNATTSQDATRYFMSLPANKLELWFALEAERFRAPVFRELYSEKRVIEEERRLRVDDAPLGKFQQEFAYRALLNNYRRPIIGWEQDFDGLGRREVVEFFAQHYGPRSLTIVLVGDVTTSQVRTLAEKYWGGWQGSAGAAQASAAALTSSALPAAGSMTSSSRSITYSSSGGSCLGSDLWLPSLGLWGGQEHNRLALSPSPPVSCQPGAQSAGAGGCYADSSVGGPLVMLGFYRPAMKEPEGPTVQVMSDLLSGSRTARLTSKLVLEQRRIRAVGCSAAYPGDKYPGMVLINAVPLPGKSPEDAGQLLLEELQRFAEEGPSSAELARVQKATKTGVLASVLSNSTMASLLASYHVMTGSWRGLLDELDLVAELKPENVRTQAQTTLRPDNMFSGYVYSK